MPYSTSFPLAIEVIIFIHINNEENCHEFLSTRIIAENLNIPLSTTIKIISKLIRSNLLESKEGAHGGIATKKDLSEVSLYEVLVSVENKVSLFRIPKNFTSGMRKYQEIFDKGLAALNQLEDDTTVYLKEVSLKDLL